MPTTICYSYAFFLSFPFKARKKFALWRARFSFFSPLEGGKEKASGKMRERSRRKEGKNARGKSGKKTRRRREKRSVGLAALASRPMQASREAARQQHSC